MDFVGNAVKWERTPNLDFPNNMGEELKPGQRVKITRTVTFEYEVDITEVLDYSDEDSITVESLIEDELRFVSKWDTKHIYDEWDVVDEMVESVEIL